MMTGAKQMNRLVNHRSTKRKEWPVVVYFWTIGLAMIGYLIGRIALDAYPHPYHWASGLVGGVIGLGLGGCGSGFVEILSKIYIPINLQSYIWLVVMGFRE
jgi:hypothetical protein